MKRMMVVILVLVLSAGLLIASCSSPSSTGSPARAAVVGNQAPGFQLLDREGQTVSLSDFRGRPVLINFWASWCGPCRFEMPFLQEAYEERSAASSSVAILTINIKENPATIDSFMDSLNLSLPVLLDSDGKVATLYNITGIPTTFFIDKDGIIQEKVVGAFPNKEHLESYLNKYAP